jgi:hypothetical protein
VLSGVSNRDSEWLDLQTFETNIMPVGNR